MAAVDAVPPGGPDSPVPSSAAAYREALLSYALDDDAAGLQAARACGSACGGAATIVAWHHGTLASLVARSRAAEVPARLGRAATFLAHALAAVPTVRRRPAAAARQRSRPPRRPRRRPAAARRGVEELIATVSHELRTPLTAIHGALGLLAALMGEALPPRAHQVLSVAQRNSQRLIRLVTSLLDLQQIESEPAAEVRPVELGRALSDAVEASEPLARPRGVPLLLEPVPAGLSVRADPDRLAQVLTNLVSNAVRFSPPGSPVVVAARGLDGRARISVSDEGPGVPEEFRQRLFERFARAAGQPQDGSGLGLSIARALVERMGGRIGYAAAERGACFYFDLPLQRSAGGEPRRASAPASDGSAAAGRQGGDAGSCPVPR